MMDANSSNHTGDWSAYWSTGALTSLSEDFAGVYDGEIERFWHDQCCGLEQQAIIADLCSGNGAIALLMAEWATRHGKEWKIAAVDAADLDPARIASAWPQYKNLIEGIDWHGRQPVESFKAEAQSHDLLTSQYGLEYSNWKASARQVMKLLKPGGRLAMINHAPDSDIMTTMRAERCDYERLAASRAIEFITAWLSGVIGLETLREQLSRPEEFLRAHCSAENSPLLASVFNTVTALRRAPKQEIESRQNSLSQWLAHLSAAHGRLNNMIAVNEAIEASPDWVNIFVEAGMKRIFDEPVLHAGKHPAGRARVLVKP